ncbi:CPBP family intramembrane metalloprotease [Cognatishimia sp. SS12]|uniref:CPBP family intramembrane glutamic endopeptidase n=1 Tax=Cognatishimia sp. SS12 TaxID=2979465 RepID=UPI00232DA2DD|nr:CPBP family intramembrane glutamic endopeptidase [Cognatishimia sp. SS12]MDC0738171.1 CPBP family intramembrane metalloprotease [Cognatishimia sp. SS12]
MVDLRRPSKLQLRLEFLLLYLATPAFIAVVLPPTVMFPALFLLTALGLFLLHHSRGFRWKWLFRGLSRVRPYEVLGFTAFVLTSSLLTIYLFAPHAAFEPLASNPGLMLMIALLYPPLSALPQELIFRPLFFGRYNPILPDGRGMLVFNAAVFAFAHLMYWSVIVTIMTFVGGFVFAWAYQVRRSFLMAVILHSIAGIILFGVGLGVFFYSGNVVRPF